MKKFFFLLIVLGTLGSALKSQTFQLKDGDLLFQDLDCGAPCQAIEAVTQGVNGASLSHVGIVINENGSWHVLEAISNGVVITPLTEFLGRSSDQNSNPKVLVGRVQDPNFDPLAAIQLAKKHLGKSYDAGFDISNDQYYCSELVYEAYQISGSKIFQLSPMTFLDPKTNELFNHWNNYFDDLGLIIPEGELGLNPGGISRSQYVTIVYAYGNPEGYNID